MRRSDYAGVSGKYNVFGTAAKDICDMKGLDKPITYNTEGDEYNRYTKTFTLSLAHSVSKAVSEAGCSASLTSYIKRTLEEYFSLNIKIADRQAFHNQMLSVVREEMQSQGMKLVGALLAGIGTAGIPTSQTETVSKEVGLPEACDQLPDELSSVLDYIG